MKDKNNNTTKSDWKKYNDQYPELTEKILKMINETELVKEFKWGGDIYTYNGKNVLAFNGFKNHFALWFYQCVFLTDPYKKLITASEGKTKALRQLRFNSIEDLDETMVKSYINEAIENAKKGLELKAEKKELAEIPEHFVFAFSNNPELKSAFNQLTKGRQNEYIEYIVEAKQEKTKLSRIEKITPLILEGKGLNDKYKS